MPLQDLICAIHPCQAMPFDIEIQSHIDFSPMMLAIACPWVLAWSLSMSEASALVSPQ